MESSSVVECLPNIEKVLSSIPSTAMTTTTTALDKGVKSGNLQRHKAKWIKDNETIRKSADSKSGLLRTGMQSRLGEVKPGDSELKLMSCRFGLSSEHWQTATVDYSVCGERKREAMCIVSDNCSTGREKTKWCWFEVTPIDGSLK